MPQVGDGMEALRNFIDVIFLEHDVNSGEGTVEIA